MADLITQAILEAHYKPRQVRDAACDDGSGDPGTSLATAISTASKRAKMILAKGGWSEESIETLVGDDDALESAVCDIAMYELTKRNLAWIDQSGRPIMRTAKDDAVALLEDVASAKLRPASESTAGANGRFGNRSNVRRDPQYMFAGSRSKPTPGGY